MAFQFSPQVPMVVQRPFFSAINTLSLSSGLTLCLDAGDASSYTSGQKWLDLAGSGYDFYRGVDNSSSTDDPTFNGSAGGLTSSEYWSFDGGDFFTYDTTNESWMNGLHKSTAKWSMACWVQLPVDAAVNYGLFGTGGTDGIGVRYRVIRSSTIATASISIQTIAGAPIHTSGSCGSASVAAGVPVYFGVSVDWAGGTRVGVVQSEAASFGWGTTNTPSASSAAYTMQIGTGGNGTEKLKSLTRMYAFSMWNGVALTAEQHKQLQAYTRDRYLA